MTKAVAMTVARMTVAIHQRLTRHRSQLRNQHQIQPPHRTLTPAAVVTSNCNPLKQQEMDWQTLHLSVRFLSDSVNLTSSKFLDEPSEQVRVLTLGKMRTSSLLLSLNRNFGKIPRKLC